LNLDIQTVIDFF